MKSTDKTAYPSSLGSGGLVRWKTVKCDWTELGRKLSATLTVSFPDIDWKSLQHLRLGMSAIPSLGLHKVHVTC